MAANRVSEAPMAKWLVSGPPLLYLLVFFAVPALIMVLASFRTPGEFGGLAPLVDEAGRLDLNTESYVRLLTESVYAQVFVKSAWYALLTSLYGHVLLIKQAFVVGLLIIAATNLLIVSPRLRRDYLQGTETTGLVARFGKILILELTFAGLLLASVSFLTYIPPAKIAAPPITDFTSIQQVDDLKVELNIAPARVGQNEFMLMLISADGRPITAAKKVLLRFTPSQANVPPSEIELISDGEMFSAKGAHLSLPGKWQVQAVVRREDKFDAYANFDVNLQKPGTSSESATIPRQMGVLILLIGLLGGLLALSLKANPLLRFGTGFPVTVLMIGIGIFFLTRPVQVLNEQANPIPPNQESVAAGQTIFMTTCAPCHGAGGKGDGPVGIALNPRPADLTLHAIPGVHTDAQLFEWITNGFPGSRMPAFKSTLSDTDRWNLVNFIRTMAPK